MHIMRPPGVFTEGLRAFVNTLPYNVTMAEVGCYAGESTAVFAPRCVKLYCVDPWCNYVEHNPGMTIPMDDLAEAEAAFDKVAALYPNTIVKVKTNSVDAAKAFQDCFFDVVYIDGLHEYDAVVADIQAWLRTIKTRGIIAGHDYYGGNHYRDVKRAVDKCLGPPDQVFADTTWMKQVAGQ